MLLAGTLSFGLLPVAPLPNVDFPAIVVSASLPGASPETMASSVATPLERSLGRIAGISEMTSSSSLGSTTVVLVFDPEKDIDGAAREVQAAINGAMSLLPSGMPNNPSYRKANPSDMPIMVLTLTSETQSRGEMYDLASTVLAPKLSQVQGVGQVSIGGSSLPAVRVDLNPDAMSQYGLSTGQRAHGHRRGQQQRPQGRAVEKDDKHWQVDANDQLRKAREYEPLVIHCTPTTAPRCASATWPRSATRWRTCATPAFSDDLPAVLLIVTPPARRQHHRGHRRHPRATAGVVGTARAAGQAERDGRSQPVDPCVAGRGRADPARSRWRW